MTDAVAPAYVDAEPSEGLRGELEHWLALTPALLHSIDENGRLIAVSDAWLAKLGYRREEVIGRRSTDFLTSESREHAINVILPEFFRKGRCDNVEYQFVCKDGRAIDVLLSAVLTQDPTGRGRASLAVVTDVTALKNAERRLAESEARYRLLAEHSTDMVLELDVDLKRRYVSPASRELFGYDPEEMLGGTSGAMAHPEDAERLRQVLRSLLSGREDRSTGLARRRHRDGRWIWVETRYRAIKDPQTGAVTGIVGAVRDISARKAVEDRLAEANRRLETLAREDGLTGLANRRTFDEALAREHRRAQRDHKSLALLMIDVDMFKAFNDRYGHPAGDECLKRIGGTLTTSVFRPCDLAARYGGEEFALLLPDIDESGAVLIGERIRQAVALLAIEHADSPHRVMTVSVGVASVGRKTFAGGPESLLHGADRALYRAKDDGRNAIVRASSLRLPAAMPSTAA
jgi:diguanylate cyclase (GGDEF)-like protein/PAS domain S-box-containing protein